MAVRTAAQKATDKRYRDSHRSQIREYNRKTVQDRSMRVAARRMMEKKHGASALRGKDVDHKRSIKRGGTNSIRNLRLVSVNRNRSRNK